MTVRALEELPDLFRSGELEAMSAADIGERASAQGAHRVDVRAQGSAATLLLVYRADCGAGHVFDLLEECSFAVIHSTDRFDLRKEGPTDGEELGFCRFRE